MVPVQAVVEARPVPALVYVVPIEVPVGVGIVVGVVGGLAD